MSVQAGIWNFEGEPVDPGLVKAILESLGEQGPDGKYPLVLGNVGLLYRPFHTTHESRREKQPYVSDRGSFLTWDGRLDNRSELCQELHLSRSDDFTEVELVSAAFDRWGTDCFPRIIGDWAVCIWNPKDCELVLAVDYMAVRHLFYFVTQHRIWWSSDLGPLVLLSPEKLHVDDEYVAGYLTREPSGSVTPYREIREVPPGHLLRVCCKRLSVEQHWKFNPNKRIRYRNNSDYEEHFRQVFRRAVKRRLRSDSPVLAELSGGLDSSSIVCMADDILFREEQLTPRLDTLSYYDNTEPRGDDRLYFEKIEQHRGRLGMHIDASTFGTLFNSFEYPEFEPLPGYIGTGRKVEMERSHFVRGRGYRAVLSGIGGDEFMGGIPSPRAQLADLVLTLNLWRLIRELTAWSLAKRKPWIQLLGQALLELLPVSLAQHFAAQAKIEPWISRTFARRKRLSARLMDVDEHFGFRLPSRRTYAAGVVLMGNKLAKLKRSVLAPEEFRYPFLDRDLIEFVLSIPATQMLRPGERRSLMRRSLKGLVPEQILDRRTKQFGARTPLMALEGRIGELQAAFRQPLTSAFGYINREVFCERLDAARNGQETHIVRMLRAVSLEFWLRDLAARKLIHLPETATIRHKALAVEAQT